ncbi:hypothetical protein [Paenibacillus apis]|uniref:HAD family hydrolase n=1 Tax=Paenibacillus apis TaxID=1792174 RepID=A0A919Y3Z0_9BACL|nr:hypothetical protein [Paenibacillus apis]GIO41970.1 hypothetical protein J41TS4_17280 [Paenibacillus apis]
MKKGKGLFSKTLFMSNFTIDLGDPNFRTGAYLKYLEPLANSLSRATNTEVRFLISRHSFESVRKGNTSSKINQNNSYIVDYQKNIQTFGLGDEFVSLSYNNNFTGDQLSKIYHYFHELFQEWEPDLIFSWEFPTTIFRSLFPNALIIDLMPGLFMRPPYPRTISFDPIGLYKDSIFKWQDNNPTKATDKEISFYYGLRDHYKTFYTKHSSREKILSSLRGADQFQRFALIPLQISNYFGFHENSQYSSQFDFLFDSLRNIPSDVGVIATQYVSGFIEEKAINEKNIDFLYSNFPNFLYSIDFEKVDNISQFIVPWTEATVSVSSTIGLQARFFGNKLISPSRSHLAYFADGTNLSEFNKKDDLNDNNMALLLSRQTMLESRLINEPDYLLAVLTGIYVNRAEGKMGLDLLFNKNLLNNIEDNIYHYMSGSSTKVALRQLDKINASDIGFEENDLQVLLQEIDNCSVVSFDIFDTLLRRSVFKPEDVFQIVQSRLQESMNNPNLPSSVINAFASLRAGSERQLRQERDEMLEQGMDVSEEITVNEVYKFMINRFGGNLDGVDALIKIEQEVELSVLTARKIGKWLFQTAINKGKTVIIVSDFIHDEHFIVQALDKCGIKGYEKLYVSSSIGKKKHSGNLFKFVEKNLKVSSDKILHIGDNPIGDWTRAHECGWKAIRISSAREKAVELLKNRDIPLKVLDKSFYLRTAFSLFSEEFYGGNVFNKIENSTISQNRELIESGIELGYLALGPVMYSFSEWIIQQSLINNCKSIVFFARDSYLPYKIIQMIINKRPELRNLKLHYISTSRQGLMGLNFLQPEDYLTVRIDDYSRKNPFSLLLKQRFGLSYDTISTDILSRWNIDDIHMPVAKLTPAAIFGIVYEHVKENWTVIKNDLEMKREIYKSYLEEQGVDLDQDTLAVDFGYKGSTHLMIRNLFLGKFIPAFFMTYSNGFGFEPMDNAKTYHLENINPTIKDIDVFLSHNLIIETLINEPVGSLVEVIKHSDNEIKVIREEMSSSEHISRVSSIQQGVLMFVESWIDKFGENLYFAQLEKNSASYWLNVILTNPTLTEAKLMSGMIFDNAYAGHSKRYIVVPEGADNSDRSIWIEGHSMLYSNFENYLDVGRLSLKRKTQNPITFEKGIVVVNNMKFPRRINVLRILHRDDFVEAISSLAKSNISLKNKRHYARMVKSYSKKYVAAKIFNENGGIVNANISIVEKVRAYYYLLRKK